MRKSSVVYTKMAAASLKLIGQEPRVIVHSPDKASTLMCRYTHLVKQATIQQFYCITACVLTLFPDPDF
jgi:hypothetical protein